MFVHDNEEGNTSRAVALPATEQAITPLCGALAGEPEESANCNEKFATPASCSVGFRMNEGVMPAKLPHRTVIVLGGRVTARKPTFHISPVNQSNDDSVAGGVADGIRNREVED